MSLDNLDLGSLIQTSQVAPPNGEGSGQSTIASGVGSPDDGTTGDDDPNADLLNVGTGGTPPATPPVSDTSGDDEGDGDEGTEGEEGEGAPPVDSSGNDGDGGSGTDEGNLIGDLAAQFGLGEDYEVPEESFDNLVAFTETVAQNKAQAMFDEYMNGYEGLADVVQHVVQGGKIEDYMKVRYGGEQAIDYASLAIDENNEAQQEQILRAHLSAQGWSQEDVDAEIADVKDMDKMLSRAQRALPILKKNQERQAAQLAEQTQKQREAQIAETKAYWEDVNSTIQTGTIGNIQIPKAEQPKFFKYLSTDTGDGTTASAQKWQKLTKEQRLKLEYFVWKDLQLDDMVEQKARTRNVQALRKKAGKNSSGLSGRGGGGRGRSKDVNKLSNTRSKIQSLDFKL